MNSDYKYLYVPRAREAGGDLWQGEREGEGEGERERPPCGGSGFRLKFHWRE